MFDRYRQRVTITLRQRLDLARTAAAPDRANRVDDITRGKIVAAGDARLPRRASAECTTFGQQTWPCGSMDCPIHTAAPQERRIGGVDNGINGQCRDVAFDDLQAHIAHRVSL